MDGLILPTRVMGLDLSLTATGLFVGDPYTPQGSHARDEIGTPARRKDEADLDWNRRRYQVFCLDLWQRIRHFEPELVVVEVTSHAHQVITRKRGTPEAYRESTTRGLEFRAGLGLGRALGWLDATTNEMRERGASVPPFVTIEARDVKLRVAGSQAASKGAVAAKLFEVWGWMTDGWRESEIDALACAVAWLRTLEGDARERTYRALAASHDAARKPVRSRPRTPARKPTASPAS